MNPAKQIQPDPLYIIFEEHLYNFKDSDSDRKTFIGNIVIDYLTYLRKMKIIVPNAMQTAVIEELSLQVNKMLVKKIYGFPTLEEYRRKTPTPLKRKARSRYSKIKKAA